MPRAHLSPWCVRVPRVPQVSDLWIASLKGGRRILHDSKGAWQQLNHDVAVGSEALEEPLTNDASPAVPSDGWVGELYLKEKERQHETLQSV